MEIPRFEVRVYSSDFQLLDFVMARSVSLLKFKEPNEFTSGGFVAVMTSDTGDCVVKAISLQVCSGKFSFYNSIKINEVIHKNSSGKYAVQFRHFTKSPSNKTGYIFMPKLDCDLVTYIEQNNVNEQCARSLIYKICQGVQTIHEAGVAHLDLKPENILLDLRRKIPYISDFDNSYLLEESDIIPSSRGILVKGLGRRGTPAYYPPEVQRNHQIYDPFSVDIFSLGILLYVIVVKQFPYNEESEHIINKLPDYFTDSFSDLIRQMTKPNPQERISIDQVLEHRFFAEKITWQMKITRFLKQRLDK